MKEWQLYVRATILTLNSPVCGADRYIYVSLNTCGNVRHLSDLFFIPLLCLCAEQIYTIFWIERYVQGWQRPVRPALLSLSPSACGADWQITQ